ncbi:MAG TPA: patatin-like phospholipase family protein [Syntrophomonadaceae bacterium]|nr:patatin-like phospholipase family protein [Syntrophomonadaceae bacterium]
MEATRPRVGLVLGAGSARGLAHIGVIQVLEENHIPFDFIVGCSIGAMVGGIYAAGADITLLDKMIECMDTSLLFDFRLPRMGFMEGKRLQYFLDLMTKNKAFADLQIPLIAVATDLISGQRVLIEEGSVSEAIRASISIPGVFRPVLRDGMVLVDGAVTDRLPVEVARSRGADIIIAVEVNYTHAREVVINNAMDVILTSLDIMQKPQFDLISKQADILIKPEVGHFSSRDFNKSRLLVDLGRSATEAKLDELRQIIFPDSEPMEA